MTLVIQNILKLHLTWVLSGKIIDNFVNVNWNVQMYIHESQTRESFLTHCALHMFSNVAMLKYCVQPHIL